MGMAMEGILLIPCIARLWTALEKFNLPVGPAPLPLTMTGLGALAVNMSCALMLARFRVHKGSMTKAAFLSARNDALANVGIILAGLITAFVWASAWPDLFIGLVIAAMNAGAAMEVWDTARNDRKAAVSLAKP
jgi:Co/Zn/Cd efflux system component